MGAIRGNIKDVVLKHDASRIVQTVVKYGGQAERDAVAEELKGEYVKLAQSRYSKVPFFSLSFHLTLFSYPPYRYSMN
jgi:pumilio homology domain family member 6